MWYDSSRAYMLASNHVFRSFSRHDYSARKGSYERLINHYYGKNSLFKRTLPYAGNYQLLDLNELAKDVELPLSKLLYGIGEESEADAEDLAESYNKLMKAFDTLDNKEFVSRKNWLTSLTKTYSEEILKAGFILTEDGFMISKTKEEQSLENVAAFNYLFQGEHSFGKHLMDRIIQIGHEALSSISRSPKHYSASGSFVYSITTGTLYNDVF